MTTSNLPRYLLLAAIAALGFMLLVEWTRFQDEHRRAAVVAQAATASPAAAVPAIAPATPEIPLPAAAAPAAPAVDATPAMAAGGSTVGTVRVRTDVLDVVIDLHGGDIVQAAFPQHLTRLDTPDRPFLLLENSAARIYVAQSGLVGPQGTDSSGQRPVFRAAASEFVLADGVQSVQVDLVLEQAPGVLLTKRYTFRRGDYLVDMEYRVDNQSATPWQAALYGQLKRDSSADPSAEGGRFGVQPFLGVATTTDEARFHKIAFSNLDEEKFSARKTDGWIAVIQHYFLSAWVPQKGVAADFAALQGGGFNYARFTTPLLVVAAGQQGVLGAGLYLGPKDQYRLEEIAANLDLSVDYGWLWWMAQPLFWLLNHLHALLGNWGFAIICLTLIIKVAFYRLSAASYRSMANMRRVQPKLVELKERYGEDRQKMSQAMMELYRKEKINPLGGCLPMLIQMPVFIALYWVLLESVELRHAPFIGYIDDLSAMDPYFILPLIMGVSMFFQQKLNPPPPDPMQAKVMQWLPVIFTFFFLWFPSGLVLYWVVNNILSIAQQWLITHNIEKAAARTA